ncbi:MAG: RtcB family protein [Burkholderiales bacterium]
MAKCFDLRNGRPTPFNLNRGGVISAAGVGFDISYGARCLRTGLLAEDLRLKQERVAEVRYRRIPAGIGGTGRISLSEREMNAMLAGGAHWVVEQS